MGNCPARVNYMQKVLTLREVSEYLRMHRSSLYRLLAKHQIPAFKVGSDWRFNLEDIDRWRRHLEYDAGWKR